MNKEYFLKGMKDGMPICLGYFSVSIAYGMAAVLQGMSILETIMISLSNLTSAGQFAGTSLLAKHAPYLELIITMLIINSRYFLMAISLSQKLDEKTTFLDRMVISYGITDEIFALEISQQKKLKAFYIFGLIFISALGWVAGTGVGAAANEILPKAVSQALGIAMYAMFIAIFIPASKKSRPILYTVVLSVVLSCLFFYLPMLSNISSGYAIVIITILVSCLMAWLFPIGKDEYE